MKKLVSKIINMVLYTILIMLFIFIIMVSIPKIFTNLSIKSNSLLSKSECKEMMEQAKLGNITAIQKLKWHYFADNNKILYSFYESKAEEIEYMLSENELERALELVRQGNSSANLDISAHYMAVKYKQYIIEQLGNNTSLMQNFLNDCSLDDFCKSSDIYKHYSQKAKNISWNKTSNAK